MKSDSCSFCKEKFTVHSSKQALICFENIVKGESDT